MAHLWVSLAVLTLTLRQTLAQSLSDIPKCAGNAAFSSLSSIGCQLTDIKCICKDHQSLVNSLVPIVKKECSPEDLQKTFNVTESICDNVGITFSVPTATSTVPTPTPTVPASTPTYTSTTPTSPVSTSISSLTPTVPPSTPKSTSTPTVPASTSPSTSTPTVPTFTSAFTSIQAPTSTPPSTLIPPTPSTPPTTSTGTPPPISTPSLVIQYQTLTTTTFGAPFANKSASSKPIAAPTNTTTLTSNSTPLAFKGAAAARYHVGYMWAWAAGLLLGMTLVRVF